MDRQINSIDKAEIVSVPAGVFIRGSSDRDADEKPRRSIHLDEFRIYKYPVTFSQYAEYCRSTGAAFPEKPRWGWRGDHPVVNVSWDDAAAYCAWAGGSLPTEAQWEKAARGTDGREYPWGNEWDPSRCRNSVSVRVEGTAPVTAHKSGQSPFGAWDMAGNAREWCADWYSDSNYASAEDKNPTGPDQGASRVVRGGGWIDYGGVYFRGAYRYRDLPGSRSFDLGFRCVLRPGSDRP